MKKHRIVSALLAGVMMFSTVIPAAAEGTRTEIVQEYSAAKKSISKATVSKISDKTYTGKSIKPSVTVKYDKKKLVKGKDYTVTYKNNKSIGTATITIKGIGSYTGTKKVTFKIVPGKPSAEVKVDDGKTTISWEKVKGAGGYQIYYSENGGKYKKLAATSKASYSTTKLKVSDNNYKVKVRAYKKSDGVKIYGAWSDEVDVKTGLSCNLSISEFNENTVKYEFTGDIVKLLNENKDVWVEVCIYSPESGVPDSVPDYGFTFKDGSVITHVTFFASDYPYKVEYSEDKVVFYEEVSHGAEQIIMEYKNGNDRRGAHPIEECINCYATCYSLYPNIKYDFIPTVVFE